MEIFFLQQFSKSPHCLIFHSLTAVKYFQIMTFLYSGICRLSYTEELQCTILEVKAIGGFGTTIDVCLVNGRLKFGQTIILPGTDGPIVTTVKVNKSINDKYL